MIERIKAALAANHIDLWRINRTETESVELFFVKKQLDTRRAKDVTKYEVTVFRDGGTAEQPLRGASSVELVASMSDEAVNAELAGAYLAAGYALNPMYELTAPAQGAVGCGTGALEQQPLVESAARLTEALFAADDREDAFLNSAELFVVRSAYHILSSEGTDVSWSKTTAEGEMVAQCLTPEDVELYDRFSYEELDCAALTARVAELLTFVKDRAAAQRTLKSGKYDVVLSAGSMPELLSYYAERSAAQMLFAHYSDWKCGDAVQGEVKGEALNLSLAAGSPYSGEGIPMEDRPLLQDGVLQTIHGGNRFCRYLGVQPTGDYRRIRCENPGTVSFAQMKQKPCLWVVRFSDFQMDSFTGHFGGEIRLAYLIDGESVTPVTGGSVNGSWLEAQQNLTLTTERYVSGSYNGPYAVRLPQVNVAGI